MKNWCRWWWMQGLLVVRTRELTTQYHHHKLTHARTHFLRWTESWRAAPTQLFLPSSPESNVTGYSQMEGRAGLWRDWWRDRVTPWRIPYWCCHWSTRAPNCEVKPCARNEWWRTPSLHGSLSDTGWSLMGKGMFGCGVARCLIPSFLAAFTLNSQTTR